MRKFFLFAVAAATLSVMVTDRAEAGGRRTRYYSYGYSGARSAVTHGSTSQAAPANTAQSNAAQSNTVRRYSYAPAQGSTTRYSYAPGYGDGRTLVMGVTPFGPNYWRADRKILGQ